MSLRSCFSSSRLTTKHPILSKPPAKIIHLPSDKQLGPDCVIDVKNSTDHLVINHKGKLLRLTPSDCEWLKNIIASELKQ